MSQDHSSSGETGLEIAIIGMAGKFPGAENVTEFWQNLRNGIESLLPLSDEQMIAAGVAPEMLHHPHYVKAAGLLRGIEHFDASFFDYTPREAQLMDPQFRLLHECVWEALEDAGYSPNESQALIGMYAGASNNIFWTTTALQHVNATAEMFQVMLLNDHNFTTRISYKLNLQGPSIATNTACSSSLVAIHLACQSLLSGETDITVAGGISINLPSPTGYLYQEGMLQSPDGHCRAFDAAASGTVFSDGVGIVVLKRLQDAIDEGDHIYAVIRGSAINNDGNQKVGYTAPSTKGQMAVIRAALTMAEVVPESISYVEAHGTATPLGDPIEVEALKDAFRTEQRHFCHIGSVKSNLGHLDAASGVAGLIKTVLALQHRQIPPSLHFRQPNPKLDLTNSPFVVATQLIPWNNPSFPLRAGVSSFGIGGTNAHVILEEAPTQPISDPGYSLHLLLLSAKTATALQQMSQRLCHFLQTNPHVSLPDVAYTLQVGRTHFAHRRLLLCSSLPEAIELLATPASPSTSGIASQEQRDVHSQQRIHNLLHQIQNTHDDGADQWQQLGQLWLTGVAIDWKTLYPQQKRQRLSLPTYPFEHQRFWDLIDQSTHAPKTQHDPYQDQPTEEKTTLPHAHISLSAQMCQSKVTHNRSTHVLTRIILDTVKSLFGFERLLIHENFFDLGASSLDIAQLCTILSEKLGQEIPIVTLYTYPSVQSLAEHLSMTGETERSEEATILPSQPTASPHRSTRSQTETLGQSIAVIGMSGRFPGAPDIARFWHNLLNAVESISWFSVEELEATGIPRELAEQPQYVKAKGILEGVEYFDAAFFDYSPKEAEIMDPQFRLLHECSWEALEDAGYDPRTYQGLIGVYSGTSPNLDWLYRLGKKLTGTEQFATMLLNDREFFSTALSYKLNLRGPSITMQTACSTSLVNIVLACQALVSGGCDMALAGGVTVTLPEKSGYLYQDGMILSPDGHCRSFDAEARGTVFGDGAGMVVLKRLQDAIDEGDHIYAVIRGSAINNDGNQKVGYTAPSTKGQMAVIRAALTMAEVAPESISYVEAHGTATPLGDPIEIEALKAAFRTEQRHFCHLGSVKSNLGHLNAASGIAGLIKTVLALQHRQIPPSLHFTQPNPKIDWTTSPFVVATQLTPWINESFPLRAGVSSFGIGGTNAHVILEEAPALPASSPCRATHLLLLSAKTPTALQQMSERLGHFLQSNPDISLADVAYTLQVGRAHFAHRRLLLCSSTQEAIAQLAIPPTPTYQNIADQEPQPLFFLFPGQGAQYVNMARELYQREPLFQHEVDRCLHLAQTYGASNLREVLFPQANHEQAAQLLTQTQVTQPVLFTIEYALAQLLLHWGMQPAGMLGHSLGEYVAACLCGVFSLEDALRLVVKRGQLMSQTQPGAMLSVSLSEAHIQPYLQEGLSLAAVNTPEQCVVAGTHEAIAALEEQLSLQGRQTRRLSTSHAFHSSLMEPILAAFEQELQQVQFHAPQLPYLSNLTGTWIQVEEASDPHYWLRHLREPVRFAQGVSELLTTEHAILLEVGPGRALSGFVRKHPCTHREQLVLNLLRHEQEARSDESYLWQQVGRLWLAGVALDWTAAYAQQKRQRISLPTYPFERQHFWIDAQVIGNDFRLPEKKQRHKKNAKIDQWFYLPSWQRSMPPSPQAIHQGACWLLFQDTLGLSERLAEQLKDHGADVIRVEIGSRYAQLAPGRYTVNPSSANDYVHLLTDLSHVNIVPEVIVHLWHVLPTVPKGFQETQILGYYSLIYLAQAISTLKQHHQIHIAVITNNLVEVTGGEDLSPEKSTIFGPCKVIPQEYSHIHCKNIDFDFTEGKNAASVAKRIFEETMAWSPDPIVAYRGQYRWTQEFKALSLAENNPTLKSGGVYVIIGGLGGIGLILANYLAQHVQAKLVLTGKSHFPERDQWDCWLDEHPTSDLITHRIQAIKRLEELGSEVLVLQADISQEAEMQAVIDETEHRYGKLNGVIHSAGLPGGETFRAIQHINHEMDEEQFIAKVTGVNVLSHVLQDRPLDFCLLFSSLATILGGLGFCAYTAANQYLDTFIQRHNQQDPTPWLCINWDAWGFIESFDISSAFGKSILALAIIPDKEGESVFQHIFNSGFRDQLVVSTSDLQERIKTWISLAETKTDQKDQARSFARPDLSNPYTEPSSDREKQLVEIWREFFRIEQVGIHDNFFELGGSSLDVIQITTLLNEKLGQNIPAVTIFTYPTIALLSGHLTNDTTLVAEDTHKYEELVEGRQRVAGRRLRRMQEDE